MSVSSPLSDVERADFQTEIARLKSDGAVDEAKRLEEYAQHVHCFYCLDYRICYKDRASVLANLDGRGDYDLVNCTACRGNDAFIDCCKDPDRKFPGIRKHGNRERHRWEAPPKHMMIPIVEALARKGPLSRAPDAAPASEGPCDAPENSSGDSFVTAMGSTASNQDTEDLPSATFASLDDEPMLSSQIEASLSRMALLKPAYETVFTALVDKCLEAYVRDQEGELEEVAIGKFLEAATLYRDGVACFGGAVKAATSDFNGNYAVVKAHFDADVDARGTVRGFLNSELEAGLHHPEREGKKLQNPSGACQLQWMLRGMALFFTMMKLLFVDGDDNAASNAYKQTLAPYHNWATTLAMKTAMKAMPSRQRICSNESICPGAPTLESRTSAICRAGRFPTVHGRNFASAATFHARRLPCCR
eukprot:gnl/TRDRNA2_/TRDRNA2_155692_c0_seq2.p1 gnl/TRDRNA2_/TRDRNA2_155692_c0~~gnl/TRDRNA2_/TRDRNA2_155692_c0_seq2.p1  ORF type:complete len:419 (+),score=81.83 gnl/TRDRNA2_/TRDRNA2_155692_c0_seq2:29-1285(+)